MDLNYETLYDTLSEIVAEKGADYVYADDPVTVDKREHAGGGEDCWYGAEDGNTPGCLIGHLIHKLDPAVDLNSLDGYGAGGAMREAGFRLVPYAKESVFLNTAQRTQDSGKSWGEALAAGKEAAERVTV